ncbi:MAG: hypothetical protein PSX36_09970 [bacterium]|nr:hypothetical protein [bacterium]
MAFKEREVELAALQQKTFHSSKENERMEGNKEFLRLWEDIVERPEILDYSFDLLKDISVLTAPDKKFKLITWNLYKNDGTHAYFGYLLVNNSKRVKKGFLKYETEEAFESFKLVDRSMTVKSPETYVGTPEKWFGMLYTQVIDCGDYYTLIGWDGNDKLTQRKFIDVLSFRSDGSPIFGKDVFKMPRKNPRRVMFEYSTEVAMSLKYSEKSNRIVYSHLSSNQEGSLLEGQFQFYGPDGSFDALELKKGKWVTVEDIDARNEKNKNDNVKKPNPKKQTPIYKPK